MKLFKNPVFRTIIYAVLFLFFAFISDISVENLQICPFQRFFDMVCPGCGTTRAFIHVMQFEFAEAVRLNPLFVFFILPASLLIFLQDTVFTVMRCFGRKKLSFVDFLLNSLFGE